MCACRISRVSPRSTSLSDLIAAASNGDMILTMFFVGMPLLAAQSSLKVKGKFVTTREQGHEWCGS
jgi:hypothetical protein